MDFPLLEPILRSTLPIRGIRIPNKLSVVAFDVPSGGMLSPALTTVEQPVGEMGRASCQKLFEAISYPVRQQVVVYPTELIVRESTMPRRRGGARIEETQNKQHIEYSRKFPAQKDFCQG
jgi:hypothetical protein